MLDESESADPLDDLRNYVMAVLRRTVSDPQARRVFEIATLKVEFVDEMDAVRQRRQHNINDWMSRAERRVARAVETGQIDVKGDVRTVARSMWIMLDGLIRTWMFDPKGFDLIKQGECMLDPYLNGLRSGCRTLARDAAAQE